MKLFLATILLLAGFSALGQEFPTDLWHDGFVVLVNEDTLVGKIKYNLEQELVQVKNNNRIQAYSGQKVFYFRILDKTVDAYREFYTLPYALVGNYEAPIFFEVLVEGKLTLLCREAVITKTVTDTNPYSPAMSYSQKVMVYTYYFLDTEGHITKYSLKKKDLLKVLSNRADKVNEYIRVNRLKTDRRYDLSRIISFYNGII